MKNLKVNNRAEIALYAAIILGITLRLFRLGSQSVWIDEYITAGFAADSNLIAVFFDSLANNPHPPLFFMLQHIMGTVFGISETSMRLLPAVFGIANIFIVQKITRSFYTEKVSVIATFLFALNPFEIYYSQEARMYSMFLMITLLMIYYFMMSIKYNSFLLGPFVFWSVMGLYTHNYTVLLLLILNVILILKYKEDIRINLWIRAQIYIFLAWIPLILFFIKGLAGEGYSHRGAIIAAPLISLKNFLLGTAVDFNFFTILVVAAAVLFLLMGVITCRTIKEKRMTDIMSIAAGLLIAVPWIQSLVSANPVYSDRTLITAGALLLIIIAIGASHLSREGIILFVAVTVAAYSMSLYGYYFSPKWQKTDYRSQFKAIAENFSEGDMIIHTYVNSYASYEFYNKFKFKKNYPDRFLNEVPAFTGNGGIREAWRRLKQALKELLGIDIYAGYDKNILAQKDIEETLKPVKRVWLVVDNEKGMKQVWLPHGNVWNSDTRFGESPDIEKLPWVKNHFRVKDKKEYYGSDVYLLEKAWL